MTERKNMLADGACLLVALIWGSGFIASHYAIEAHLSAALIMALRFGIASLTMLVVCAKRLSSIGQAEVLYGSVAGVLLFCAFYLQILGQERTTVSNSAFLTATNVVMVPFVLWVAHKKRPPLKSFLLAGTTLLGVWLLTSASGGEASLSAGDGAILLCALFFALHIAYLGYAVKGRDALVITLIQLSVAALISMAVLLLFDRPAMAAADLSKGLWPTLYLGFFSTCLCYLLQTWTQQYASPAKTGVLLSTEGLFGSLFSVLLGFEPLSLLMGLGGLVILLSVILMELPLGENNAKRRMRDESHHGHV